MAHNVTAEEFDRLPKARSFQGLALTAPSVNAGDIEGGFQVNGASGAENAFTVDGVVTNSLITAGPSGHRVRVPAGSAGEDRRDRAEYGGALGGVISAVTKSGGNTSTGRALLHRRQPTQRRPGHPARAQPGDDKTVAFVQDEKQREFSQRVGGSIGGPIVREAVFSAQRRLVSCGARTTTGIEQHRPGVGDQSRHSHNSLAS